MTLAEPPAATLSLDELLERARQEPTALEQLKWCDPIVECGIRAIEAIKSWLGDPARGFFAVIVIRRAGERWGAQPALTALCEGRSAAPVHVRRAIATAVEQLGGRCGAPVLDDRYARSYTSPDSIYHLLIDHVADVPSWGELHLTMCNWAYTNDALESLGGPVDPTTTELCGHCRNAQERRHD